MPTKDNTRLEQWLSELGLSEDAIAQEIAVLSERWSAEPTLRAQDVALLRQLADRRASELATMTIDDRPVAPPLASVGPADTATLLPEAAGEALVSPGSLLRGGDRVDQYEIVRLVGHGATGWVYLARDALLGRKVAVKLIHPDLLRSAGAVERFLFEARATARFNHPHIVTIYGLGQVAGSPYLALEYLEGESLRERIRNTRLTPGEAAEIALRTAEALAEAHRQGVMHCDLKPENIFLPRDGRLRVLDFGLAKLVDLPGEGEDSDDPAYQKTAYPEGGGPGAIRGTVPYLAPEQWRQQPLAPSADLWAFGVTLFELLVGRRPFAGTRLEIFDRVACSTDPPPRVDDPTVPEALVDLCARCIDRDPQRRPTAAEITEDLDEWLRAQRQSLRPPRKSSSTAIAVPAPFRGLSAFRREHAAMFYGRDTETAAFVERLREAGMLAVVGTSGAGKSSFIGAGVIPSLESVGRWHSLVLRPGPDPFGALAAALLGETSSATDDEMLSTTDPDAETNTDAGFATTAPIKAVRRAKPKLTPRELAERLRSQPGLLGQRLRGMASKTGRRVFLFVDQFEELFTMTEDPDHRRAFCEAMTYAGDDARGPVRVVFTVREDFLGRLGGYPDFVALVSRGIFVLRTPGTDALAQTLVQPLADVGYAFEDEQMVPEMVAEVADEPSGLPLLQFAAERLWEGRDEERKVLLRQRYEEIGGVVGALTEHADKVLDGLVGPAARAARSVLLRLVTPEGNRNTVPTELLVREIGPEAREVIDRLVDARLVVGRRAVGAPESEATIELVHESLIHRWGRLRRWRDESREDVVFEAELRAASGQWARRGGRSEDLWRGKSLLEALEWRERQTGRLDDEVAQFIARSEREARDQAVRLSRVRWVMAGGVLLLLLSIGAFLWINTKERRATRAQRAAEAARRRAQGSLAVANLEGAVAARLRGDLSEARAKLRSSFQVRDSVGARGLFDDLLRHPLRFRGRHVESVEAVAIDPRGEQLASGSYDGVIRLWRWSTGSVRVLRGHRKEVLSVAFGPRGKLLVSGAGDGDVRLWNLKTGRSRALRGHLDRVNAVAFDPSGERVASAGGDGQIKIWPLQGAAATTLRGHRGRVNAIAFDPTAARLVSGGEDGTVRIWNLAAGTARVLRGHEDDVLAVAVSANGERIASGGEDRAVRLWPARGGAPQLLRAHTGAVTAVAFAGPQARVASGSTDNTIRLWDLNTGKSREIRGHTDRVTSLAFNRTGRYLASGSFDNSLRLWDTSVQPPSDRTGHGRWVSGVAFSPDGRQLASASQDKTIRLWDVATGSSRALRGHRLRVMAVAYSRDGQRLASGSWDRTVRVWNLVTGRVRVMSGHRDRVYSVDFSPDGKRVVSGAWDKTVRIWSLDGSKPLVLDGHQNRVFGVRFSPDGQQVASASWDKTLRLWTLGSPDPPRVLTGHDGRLTGLSWWPSGGRIATVSYDRTLRIWDLSTGEARTLAGHRDYIWGVAVSPDGRFVATASRDRTARLWDAQTGQTLRVLGGHTMDVNRIAWSPNSRLVATGSDDGTVRLWEVPSGRPHWRALLMLTRGTARLLTGRGLVAVGMADGPAPRIAPRNAAEARTIAAVDASQSPAGVSVDERRLAIRSGANELTLWDAETGRARWRRAWPQLQHALPVGDGAVGIGGGRVELRQADKARDRVLMARGAAAMGIGAGMIVVAGSRQAKVFSATGDPIAARDIDVGATAVALTRQSLIVGYRDGMVDIIHRWRQGGAAMTTSQRLLEDTPATPVTVIQSGPGGTLALGFRDGTVGLWNTEDGKRLQLAHLHGPLRFLRLVGPTLYAATELGDARALDLSIFLRTRCDVMRRLWRAFPAEWQQGRAILRPAPAKHPCRR